MDIREVERGRIEDIMEMQDDQQMEENNNQDEEMQDVNTRFETSFPLLDNVLRYDDELDLESNITQKHLSKEELEDWVAELAGVEIEADEAQEALENESLAKVEGEVKEESALRLRCVEEQLDGASVELPKLHKMIESQVPKGCYSESSKRRDHWVGTQATKETVESLANAETFLHTHRPVQKRHGKLLEEGASVFLDKKSADDGFKECVAGPSEPDRSSHNNIFTGKKDDAVSFGSKNWASVYSANTPQKAAAMGLEFPGVNEVNEEDDINIDRELQLRLNRKRRSKQVMRDTEENSDDDSAYLDENPTISNLAEDQVKCPETSTQFQNNEVNKEENGNLSNSNVVTITDLNADTMRDDSQNTPSNFKCTACNNVAVEVHTHPLLQVIVCMDCKRSIEERLAKGNDDSLERYCEWCGHIADLIDCHSCEKHFCASCIKRNIGDECLSEAQSYGRVCCCCAPISLQRLTLELEKATGVNKSSSDIADVNVATSSKKKIRLITDDAELGKDTKGKKAIEKEQQKRPKSFPFSTRYRTYSSLSNGKNVLRGAEALGDAHTGYIVNVFRETGEEVVRIPPSISAQLKDHQVTGIRFMWENIVQSINSIIKYGDKGHGCILAHTMGLGKTFQVIAFLYTAMRCVDLGFKTALIVTPVNVLHNWRNEFMKWMPSEVNPLGIFMLEDVSREMRLDLLMEWRSKGGVLLLGYATFRNLSLGKGMKDINAAREIYNALRDGPDILVCDEAHTIKNTGPDTTKALKQVKCQRRIALTGSPLQNNIMEYYCMVDIVREGFLGSSTEFRNRFQNPIESGKNMNSTAEDVKIMNRSSHILYEKLKGFVQRMDMNVMKNDLPPKTVFVISVELSPLQRKLYKRFLDRYGISDGRTDERMRENFFSAYQVLAQILNHPGILPKLSREGSKGGGRASIVNIPDDSSSDENVDCNMDVGEKQRTMNGSQDEVDGYLQEDWWVDLLDKTHYKEPGYSGKIVLLLDILSMCADVDDKAIVFSQSIQTLDLIELYLSRLRRDGTRGKYWEKGSDWYRIDGKIESSERQMLVDKFNEPENKRVKCTLISTRAGSLGINLYAANRVIIVDGSWNPTYDLQAIDRAWSYGQKKPVFAYRLMARGTIEENIYKRQVTKEGLAARVVDRNISKEEMLQLFEFDEAVDGQNTSLEQKVGCCSDKLMENLLERHNPNWISSFHEHEALLKENEAEKLKTVEEVQHVPVEKLKKVEEVQHVPVVVQQKPSPSPQTKPPRLPKRFNRSRFVRRNCTRTAHKRTIISQRRKVGSSTICGECGLALTWDDLTPARATKIDYF
ncbi:Protein CHROMATIN REMODELING 20 [Raphanus sativus]|nr:Protein CHROMATIN REMODELING 20 [Raphanus sativus]